MEQNDNLSQQITELQKKLKGLNPNDPKYEEYKGQIQDITKEIRNNIDTIIQWQTA